MNQSDSKDQRGKASRLHPLCDFVKKTGRSRRLKYLLAAALVFVLVGTGVFPYVAGTIMDLTMTEKEVAVNEKPFVMFLSGTDVDSEAAVTGKRSDANLVIAVNPSTKKLAIVSLDRDSYVTVDSKKDKLCNMSVWGSDKLKNAVEQLMDVNIDYGSTVNFTGVEAIVDAIGGIDVEVTQPFTASKDASPIPYEYQVGTNHCDGAMALALCRERKAFPSDNEARSKNQIQVLIGRQSLP